MSQQDLIAAQAALHEKIEQAKRKLAAMPRAPIPEGACTVCGGFGEVLRNGVYVPCPACMCPKCGNLGYVRYEVPIGDPRFGKFFPCPHEDCRVTRQAREKRLAELRRYSSLPREYADCTFDSFDQFPDGARAGKEAARAFVELWARQIPAGGWFDVGDRGDFRNCIVLQGINGVGKTGLGAAAGNYLIGIGFPVLYIRLQDLLAAVQRRYGKAPPEGYRDGFGQRTADEVLDAVKTADVLIVDEFDVPDPSDNKRANVELIVRYRHGRQLPMLTTTNCSEEESMLRWGPTITSVLYAQAHTFVVGGTRLRKQATLWQEEDGE